MSALGGLGIGLSLVFGLLFLAFVFEVYYLLWWNRRIAGQDSEEERRRNTTTTTSVLPITCCNHRHSSCLSSVQLNSQLVTNGCYGTKPTDEEEGGLDLDLVRLHGNSNPMSSSSILFTIMEETKEDLESDDGRSKGDSRGRSLSDVVVPPPETPYLTPLSSPPFFTPPMTPFDSHYNGFNNPLFETVERGGEAVWVMPASPPPKFKFLRDAEEKLYRKMLREEAKKLQRIDIRTG